MPAPDVSVVTSGHDVADARLHREVAALRAAGLTVEVLGLGSADQGPAGAAVRGWVRPGLLGRAVLALTLPWRARGRVLLSLDPDSALGCAVAARARRRRWVADVHEDYRALLRDRRWAAGAAGRVGALVASAASRSAAAADLTVVADDHLEPSAETCRRRLVLRNLPDLDALTPVRVTPPDVAGPRRAVYVGDLRASRGPRAMVEAVADARGWELDLVGPVPAADRPWFLARLAEPDVAGRVRWHGRLPPDAAWRVAAGASVGLALLDDTPAFRETVPTKVYEYLAAGLAVLATPLPRVAALLEASGAGVTAGSAQQAAAVLRGWSQSPDVLAGHRAAARAWADTGLDGATERERFAQAVVALAQGDEASAVS